VHARTSLRALHSPDAARPLVFMAFASLARDFLPLIMRV
jgi:hypothetical protein